MVGSELVGLCCLKKEVWWLALSKTPTRTTPAGQHPKPAWRIARHRLQEALLGPLGRATAGSAGIRRRYYSFISPLAFKSTAGRMGSSGPTCNVPATGLQPAHMG